MSGAPDPKAGPRVIDRTATKRALLAYPECLACGRAASNGHHVLPIGRGQSGDDLVANIVGLCGTGASGCHGAFHGSPYTVLARDDLVYGRGYSQPIGRDVLVERRDAEWVARRVGARLPAERPDTIAYVIGKLGDAAGRDFLVRRYYLEAA